MRWKLGLLALVALVLIIAPFVPIDVRSVSVRIDMPPGATVASSQVDQAIQGALWMLGVIYVAAVLGGAVGIAWLIIRHERAKRSGPA